MHAHGPRTPKVLTLSLVATLAYIVLNIVIGIRAHSLALLSEAGHNASDFLALLLSWLAIYFQTRPADSRRTFGYSRAGVLAAFVNALSLVVVAAFILYEAIERLQQPPEVQPRLMLIVAAIGVAMNGLISFGLWTYRRDLNLRAALVHQLGDTASTGAVIAGALAIMFTGSLWIDPVLSILIAALILWSSFAIIRETLNILLEGTPRALSLATIAADMLARPGVVDVHDLHVWSIGSEVRALACHVAIADIPPSESEAILRDLQQRLRDHFRIEHTTIQFEHAVCDVHGNCVAPQHFRPREHTH